MRPVPRRGDHDPQRLEQIAVRGVCIGVHLAQGQHGHHAHALDRGQGKADDSERDKPERHRVAVLAKDLKCRDGDAERKHASCKPEEYGQADLQRVARGVHQEARRGEHRRHQDEVHQHAAADLYQQEHADDRANVFRSAHDNPNLGSDRRDLTVTPNESVAKVSDESEDHVLGGHLTLPKSGGFFVGFLMHNFENMVCSLTRFLPQKPPEATWPKSAISTTRLIYGPCFAWLGTV
jgi:hypothetical protein